MAYEENSLNGKLRNFWCAATHPCYKCLMIIDIRSVHATHKTEMP